MWTLRMRFYRTTYFGVGLFSAHYMFVTATGWEETDPRKTFYFILFYFISSFHHQRLFIVAAY